MKNALLFDGLEYWRRITPNKPALILDNSEEVSYEELGRRSDGAAVELQALGVGAGDRVAICGANCIEWIVWAFAALKAGAILVPFNERFVRDELAHLIHSIEPKVIVADAQRLEALARVARGAALVRMEGATFVNGAPPQWRPTRVKSTDVGTIIFTSGTTGQPKGVMYGHEESIANYLEMGLVIPGIGMETVHLMSVSVQSALGTTWGFLFTTTVGGVYCFMRKFDPALALNILVEQRVTFCPCFPLVLDQIARQPEFDAADLSSLRMVSAGGARVEPELLARWRKKGVLLRQMYGQTEVGGFAVLSSDEEAREGRLSCGRPMIFKKIRIVDAEGAACASHQPGEIQVNGPGIMLGYWKNPEATAQTIVDGWVRTGDLGVMDEEGRLTFVDRLKDMIITGGFNVSPMEVEAAIAQLPEIVEVAVFAAADDKFGEAPAAVYFSSQDIEPEAILAHCRAHLAGYKLPRHLIRAAEPLPRLSNGKIAKRVLATEYADKLPPASPTLMRS